MKEYKIKKGWGLFMYILAPILIVVFGGLVILFIWGIVTGVFAKAGMPFYLSIPVMLVVAWLTGMMIVGLLDVKGSKIIITENSISIKSTLKNRTLKFEEIKGFRFSEHEYGKSVYIIPLNSKKDITIAYSSLENGYELLYWLESQFINLEQEETKQEVVDMLENVELGADEEERVQTLKRAKFIATIFNWVGGIICIWAFFFSDSSRYSIIACIIFPVIALIVTIFQKGISFNGSQTSPYPSITVAMFASIFILAFRTFVDFDILDYSNMWLPASFITIIMSLFLLIGSRELKEDMKKNKKLASFLFIIIIPIAFFPYGYGAITTINCFYDNNKVQKTTTQILNHWSDEGNYYLQVNILGQTNKESIVSISEELYNETKINDTIKVYLYQGMFNIPYFELGK